MENIGELHQKEKDKEDTDSETCRRLKTLRPNRGMKSKAVAVHEDGTESEIGFSEAELELLLPGRKKKDVKKTKRPNDPKSSQTSSMLESQEKSVGEVPEEVMSQSQASVLEGPSTPLVYGRKSTPRENILKPVDTSTPIKHRKFQLRDGEEQQDFIESDETHYLSDIPNEPSKGELTNSAGEHRKEKKKLASYSAAIPFFDLETGKQLVWEECKGKHLQVEVRMTVASETVTTVESVYFACETDVGWPVPQNTHEEAEKVGDNSTYIGFVHHVTMARESKRNRDQNKKPYGNLHIMILCHWCAVKKGHRKFQMIARFRSLGTYDHHQTTQHSDFSGYNRRLYERESNGSRAYTSIGVDQEAVEKALTEAIVSANLAHMVVDNPKVRELFKLLNPNFNLPRRTKVTEMVKKLAEKVWRERRREFLANVQVLGGTLQIDGWSDRHQLAVIGIIFTYCDQKMRFRRVMLACKHHKLRSTGLNIAAFVRKEIQNNGLQDKVNFTITDGGANMLCSMKMIEDDLFNNHNSSGNYELNVGEDTDDWETVDGLSDDDESEVVQENSGPDSETSHDNEENGTYIGVNSKFPEDQSWGLSSVRSLNVCNVHKAQLIIKDLASTKFGCESFREEFLYMKKIVAFIRDHHMTLILLKELTGQTLKAYCKTRWNAVCLVLERITQPKVFAAVTAILKTANILVDPKKVSIPETPTLRNYLKWQFFYYLLSPILELSNQLQADGITAHLVIPTVVKAYLTIHETPVPEPSWKETKDKMLALFLKRFESVCENEVWLVASLMTYSSYTRNTFKWYRLMVVPVLKDDPFHLPNEDDAIKIAEKLIPSEARLVKKTYDLGRSKPRKRRAMEALNTTLSDAEHEQDEDQQLNTTETLEGPEINVLELYLITRKKLYARKFQDSPPEAAWIHFVNEFPLGRQLFNFMRAVYSLPASTASVERLFSQVGNIFTARRNRLNMRNVERLVLLKCAIDDEEENFKRISGGEKLRQVYERNTNEKGMLEVKHYTFDDSVTSEKIEDFVRCIAKKMK